MLLSRYGWFMALAAILASGVSGSVRADEGKEKKVAQVAHIHLSGDFEERAPAADPFGGAQGENFRTRLERLKKAAGDKEIKALLLEIDGLALGWGKVEELTRAITEVRKSGKKVYAYLEQGNARDYLVALACDEVCIPEAGWLM